MLSHEKQTIKITKVVLEWKSEIRYTHVLRCHGCGYHLL